MSHGSSTINRTGTSVSLLNTIESVLDSLIDRSQETRESGDSQMKEKLSKSRLNMVWGREETEDEVKVDKWVREVRTI